MSSNDDDMFSPAHYEAIGRLVVQCSRLDTIFTDLISIFLETHILPTVMMVHHQQFSSKYDTLVAALKFFDETTAHDDPLLRHINRAKAIYDYRSTLVHALWGLDASGQPRTVRTSARGKFNRNVVSVPTEEIQQRAREARELADLLSGMREHLHQSQDGPSTPGP